MNKLSYLAGHISLFGRSTRREALDAYAELRRYDDHMLKDIGLSRRDLEGLKQAR